MSFDDFCSSMERLANRPYIAVIRVKSLLYVDLLKYGLSLHITSDNCMFLKGNTTLVRTIDDFMSHLPNDMITCINDYCDTCYQLAPTAPLKHVDLDLDGDDEMTKKEINEQIGKDVRQLASDLTKKKEIDKSTSIAKDVAKKLGVKLPKSTK